jgi:hypothetical protein
MLSPASGLAVGEMDREGLKRRILADIPVLPAPLMRPREDKAAGIAMPAEESDYQMPGSNR